MGNSKEKRSLSKILDDAIKELSPVYLISRATKKKNPYTVIIGRLYDVRQSMTKPAIWNERNGKMYQGRTSRNPKVFWKLIEGRDKEIEAILRQFGYKGKIEYWHINEPSYVDSEILFPKEGYITKEIALLTVKQRDPTLQKIYPPPIEPRKRLPTLLNYN